MGTGSGISSLTVPILYLGLSGQDNRIGDYGMTGGFSCGIMSNSSNNGNISSNEVIVTVIVVSNTHNTRSTKCIY